MDRYVITASLKEIRSGTCSQWRLMSAGVMCSDRRILKVSRAAAFWTDWRRWMRLAGSSVVNKDFVHKDQDQDQDLPLKDQDKDKDLSVKDKDKDLSKYSINDHLERYLYGAEISMF